MSERNKTCALCGADKIRKGKVSLVREVGSHVFSATVVGHVCGACGESFTDIRDGERFDLAVAAQLSEAAPSGEAFRFLRKVAGLKAREVASMFGVTNDTISRWENGKHAIERPPFFILGQLVREKAQGSTTMLDLLLRGQMPKPLPERIEVHLD
ncbi:MAG: type II toxin-antitoxin system MqsA family antitoxin [Polyangiaceae bacterium]